VHESAHATFPHCAVGRHCRGRVAADTTTRVRRASASPRCARLLASLRCPHPGDRSCRLRAARDCARVSAHAAAYAALPRCILPVPHSSTDKKDAVLCKSAGRRMECACYMPTIRSASRLRSDGHCRDLLLGGKLRCAPRSATVQACPDWASRQHACTQRACIAQQRQHACCSAHARCMAPSPPTKRACGALAHAALSAHGFVCACRGVDLLQSAGALQPCTGHALRWLA
jgi:hypothetical protein